MSLIGLDPDNKLTISIHSLEAVLSGDEDQKHIVAQCQLPFSFNVVPKLQGKRKRVDLEQEGDFPTPEPRNVRPRINGSAPRNPPGHDQNHLPAPGIDYHGPLEGVQSSEDSSSSSPPLAPPVQPLRSVGTSSATLNPTGPPNQAIAPPGAEGERVPTLTEVNPESGPITGGARIWLKGLDFPAVFPLFARFGTAVVPTVSPFHLLVTLPLIDLLRHLVIPSFSPVVCLPQPRQASSTLNYRSIPRTTRQSMGPASRSFTI